MKSNNATCRFSCNTLLFMSGVVVWAFFISTILQAQQPKPNEYQVKAAYLYNFGRFVKWPPKVAGQESSFAICVLGHDPFGAVLDSTLTGKVLDGKPVVIKRLSKPQDAANCRILFIDPGQGNHLKDILPALNQASVLTVSDMPDFSQRGGMIQFVLEENKVRFEVNLTSTENAGLMLSSELLKVASIVKGNSRSGTGG
jgi:hypothetical protein